MAAIPLLFVLSLVSFSLVKAAPGDPLTVMLGNAQRDISPAQLSEMRRQLGLDRTFAEQYGHWLAGILTRGDFGRSYTDGRPVLEIIKERLPATVTLVLLSLIVSFVVGIGWGFFMIWLRISPTTFGYEGLLFSLAIVFYSSPSFWLGLLVIAALARCPQLNGISLLGLHSPGQSSSLFSWFTHMLLPALVLASRRTAKTALFVRASALDELSKDYVLTARSKGLSKVSVLVRHVARNSFLPVVSLVGLALPALLGGSVLVEAVFAWPGMGRLAVESTFARNYPVMLALIMLYGTMVIVSSLVADIVQILMDPRLSTELSDKTTLAFGSAT
jgi:peptide/nickel transport system permease protein